MCFWGGDPLPASCHSLPFAARCSDSTLLLLTHPAPPRPTPHPPRHTRTCAHAQVCVFRPGPYCIAGYRVLYVLEGAGVIDCLPGEALAFRVEAIESSGGAPPPPAPPQQQQQPLAAAPSFGRKSSGGGGGGGAPPPLYSSLSFSGSGFVAPPS